MSIFSQHSRSVSKRGFTLIELLVVISIMLILTSIFLLRQQRFNSTTLLRSLAYSVALSVRQAQVYGTSIRESATGAFDAGTAAKAYGVYFSSANTGSYVLFADIDNDGQYDAPGENVKVFSLSTGYAIDKFCATTNSAVEKCWTSGSPTITNLSFYFRRPNPDTCFTTSAGTNACAPAPSGETYTSGYVRLVSGADTRIIKVTLTGQITVCSQNAASC